MISIELSESDSKIETKINNALKPLIKKYIKQLYDEVLDFVIVTFAHDMILSDIYSALGGRGLLTELGMRDGQKRYEIIVDTWLENLKKDSFYTDDGFVINAVRADYSDVINLKEAEFLATSKTHPEGITLKWLDWLLFSGSADVVTGYHIKYNQAKYSRTDNAIMVPKGNFHIPEEFQGTKEDNFATRICDIVTTQVQAKALKIAKGIKV